MTKVSQQHKMSSDWQTVSAKKGPAQISNKYTPPSQRELKMPTYDEMFAATLPSTSIAKLIQKAVTGATPLSDLVKARAASEAVTQQLEKARLSAEAEDRPVNDFIADQISILKCGVPTRVLSIPGRFMMAAALRQQREEHERYERQWGDIAPYYEPPKEDEPVHEEYDDDYDDRQSESSGEDHAHYEDYDNIY